MTSTYTYAILEVSKGTFEEIKEKLKGYEHVFHNNNEYGTVIDMHGIAVGFAATEIVGSRLHTLDNKGETL